MRLPTRAFSAAPSRTVGRFLRLFPPDVFLRRQPQEREFPLRRSCPRTEMVVPQSHLHAHMACCPLDLIKSLPMTTSLPKRWPVMSITGICVGFVENPGCLWNTHFGGDDWFLPRNQPFFKCSSISSSLWRRTNFIKPNGGFFFFLTRTL